VSRIRIGVAAVLCAAMVAAVASIAAQAPAPASDKLRFELKFEKDASGQFKPFYQKMKTEVAQQIKVQGQDLTQKQESTFYFEWKPLKQEGDKWILKQKLEGLEMKIDISGNPIEYKSSQKEAAGSAGNPGLVDFFRNLEGSEFTVTLNKDFKVEKVEGKEEFVKKLGAGSPQMDNMLKRLMTDDALKQMCDPTFALVPDQPKGVGESWEKKVPINLGPVGTYEITYKFTYKGKDEKEKDKDKIEVDTTLVYKPPAADAEGLLFKIKSGELKSTNPEKGVILYDPKAGRVARATVKLKISGTVKVTISGSDTDVELNQELNTTIESSDKSLMEPKK
jgi:hypothetical protein